MIIGSQIKRLRRGTGINQKTFAFNIGLSPVHYCAIENNKQTPTIKVLEKIAIATDTQLVITFIDKE
uniref:Putative DNA binding, helix-turn-helix domain containing protein n=1 Tax=viral metagenome TaxID=1070528 RepID=A0A6M3MFZ7_9ZZZZ